MDGGAAGVQLCVAVCQPGLRSRPFDSAAAANSVQIIDLGRLVLLAAGKGAAFLGLDLGQARALGLGAGLRLGLGVGLGAGAGCGRPAWGLPWLSSVQGGGVRRLRGVGSGMGAATVA